jgi:hypothetical protein
MEKQKLVTGLILAPIIILAVLNFLLIFTPEMGFDALWYHLTLPKLWLLKHQWYFPGGLLYYSAMPRLGEIIFTPMIRFFGTAGPKLIQYSAGIGSVIVMWKIMKKQHLSNALKISAVSLFYCTWLVAWQSGSAYIDLIRTFFEVSALYYLLLGSWKKGGILLGLAIGTKWFSLGSLAIYALIFGPRIIFPALVVSLPWFILAFSFTGNPIYPIFGNIIGNSFVGITEGIKNIFLTPYLLTKPFDDFLSPLAGLIFVFSLLMVNNNKSSIRKIAVVGVLGTVLVMLINPPSSRYLLPYFPALCITSVLFVSNLKNGLFNKVFIGLVIISAWTVLSLRIYASVKYLPVWTGKMSHTEYLTAFAKRLPGTFIDSDGYVESLPKGSKILVDKFHNLYYFPGDFDHTSWVSDTSGYDYLITSGESQTPGNKWLLIHESNLGVQVFKQNK